MRPIIEYLKQPKHILHGLLSHTAALWPDKIYLKLSYYFVMGKSLNLKNPKTFNEKLQWLKLYNRKPEYTALVDKYEVKRWVAKRIGEEYVIPTISVYNTVEEIEFKNLPNQFVLKCTHDSGGIVVCKDQSKLDITSSLKILSRGLKKNYYNQNREWPYKNVQARIIAEKYMEDSSTEELRDYKFFCFDGKVKFLFIASDRMNKDKETKFDFFDSDFNHLPVLNGHPNSDIPPCKPQNYELMKELASKLSVGIPHVRVDLYEVNGKVYFGEMTFFHWSGMVPFDPEEWDYKFGEYISVP